MAVQQGDFIQIDFTGKVEGKVFDTSIESIANESGLQKGLYEPLTIVVGEGHVIPGLDEAFVGKEIGKFSIKVPAEKAFGKKNPKLLKIVPAKDFKKQNIKPFVGMQVNIDGMPGIVKTSGGRVIVDFNHPLSSKEVEYDIDIKKVLESNDEKVHAIVHVMGVPHEEVKVSDKVVITLPETPNVPDQFKEQLSGEIERLTKLKTEFKSKSDKK